MSAVMEPGDGRRQERTVRDDNGICEVTQGHMRSRSFPVRFDAYGKPDAWAVEWTDTVTDDTFFLVHIPGLEDVRADFPEHELTGPLQAEIAARIHGEQPKTRGDKVLALNYSVPCVRCHAAAGEPCHPVEGSGAYERGYVHKPREVLAPAAVIECPHCAAPVGQPCISENENVLRTPHRSRVINSRRKA